MWRGYGRGLFRGMRRGRRWRNRMFGGPFGGWGFPGYGYGGYGYGPRRGPCCCLFFALPLMLLPLAAVAMFALHVL